MIIGAWAASWRWTVHSVPSVLTPGSYLRLGSSLFPNLGVYVHPVLWTFPGNCKVWGSAHSPQVVLSAAVHPQLQRA